MTSLSQRRGPSKRRLGRALGDPLKRMERHGPFRRLLFASGESGFLKPWGSWETGSYDLYRGEAAELMAALTLADSGGVVEAVRADGRPQRGTAKLPYGRFLVGSEELLKTYLLPLAALLTSLAMLVGSYSGLFDPGVAPAPGFTLVSVVSIFAGAAILLSLVSWGGLRLFGMLVERQLPAFVKKLSGATSVDVTRRKCVGLAWDVETDSGLYELRWERELRWRLATEEEPAVDFAPAALQRPTLPLLEELHELQKRDEAP